jgi:VCBS repeat-containing protein
MLVASCFTETVRRRAGEGGAMFTTSDSLRWALRHLLLMTAALLLLVGALVSTPEVSAAGPAEGLTEQQAREARLQAGLFEAPDSEGLLRPMGNVDPRAVPAPRAAVYDVTTVVDNFASPAGYLALTLFTPTAVVPGDEGFENFGVPTFDFAGVSYDTIGIVSNGYVVVGGATADDVEFINTNFPDQTLPNNVLAPFWTDLNPAAGGDVWLELLTDGFDSWVVVEWEAVPNSTDGLPNTAQVWIGYNTDFDPTEDISFTYATVSGGDGGFLTVGAENQFGNRGDTTYFNGGGTPPAPSFGGGSAACDVAWPAAPCYEVDVSTVLATNDPPTAVADGPYVVPEGQMMPLAVTGNDTDPDLDELFAVPGATTPANGTVAFSRGTAVYTHDGSETLGDSFSYKATDGQLESGEVTVTIEISPVNDVPVAVADGPFVVDEGGTLVGGTVLSNDTDVDSPTLTAVKVTDPAHGALTLNADGTFTYVHDFSDTTSDSFTYAASDGADESTPVTVSIVITPRDNRPHTVGVVDPATGIWNLRNTAGVVTSFFYGNPGDVPFMGDWDGDGVDTPGLFRQSDAFVYLRNSNSQGNADIKFFFGNPGDVPVIGDWDGDGDDTVGIYRPSTQEYFVINKLGANNGGLGAADYSFVFGNPGDKPVTGDWDGDGVTEIGLHRESSGFFYWRNTLDTGLATGSIFFGDPGDRFVAGDWGVLDIIDTPAVFRPGNSTFYFRNTLTEGVADSQFPFGETTHMPVAGNFGLG